MAQIGGRAQRVVLQSLELLADDGGLVLGFDRSGPTEPLTIKVRKPWESAWLSSLPTFTVDPRDAELLGKLVSAHDAWYERERLNQISSADFTAENPEPPVEAVDPNCAPLDVERAKAANLAEERELLRLTNLREHALSQHQFERVEGCEKCYAPDVIEEVDPA